MAEPSGHEPPPSSSSSAAVAVTNTTTSSSTKDSYDPAFYTWSTFFRAATGNASRDEMLRYAHAKSIANEDYDCRRCDDAKSWLLQHSPVVRFMREQVAKLGGDLNEQNIRCRRCDVLKPGGLKHGACDPDYGILLCANALRDRSHQEDVMAHEMVHAYDHMRFGYDRADIRHLACTEIRASTLSGECRWTREFFKNRQWAFTRHFQECVRRRATLSVAGNRLCDGDEAKAKRAVDEVWASCFADTRPFDEIYR